jgi:hypothetical protein
MKVVIVFVSDFEHMLGLLKQPESIGIVPQTCFLSSPFFNVILFIVSHFSLLARKLVIFQNAWGVRKFGSPHSLHDGIGCKGIFPFKRRKLGKGAGFDFALAFVVGYDDSL